MKKIIKIVGFLLILYLIGSVFMFINQENIIFFPKKLPPDYVFDFDHPFEEIEIPIDDQVYLNGLLFKADSSKGLIFYLHGNAGALDSWGWSYQTYTSLSYDFFILDYRGYGKSDGQIESEQQFMADIQIAFDYFCKLYDENSIIVIGYSLGTCAAAKLASENHPRMLVLQAPYYSFVDLKDKIYPFIPDILVRYKFETYKYLNSKEVPAYLFHGDRDEIISHDSSINLQKHLKTGDKLQILKNQGHNGMNENIEFKQALTKLFEGSF